MDHSAAVFLLDDAGADRRGVHAAFDGGAARRGPAARSLRACTAAGRAALVDRQRRRSLVRARLSWRCSTCCRSTAVAARLRASPAAAACGSRICSSSCFVERLPPGHERGGRAGAAPLCEFNEFFTRALEAGARPHRRGSGEHRLAGGWHRERDRPHRRRHALAGEGHDLHARGAAGAVTAAERALRRRLLRDALSRALQLSPHPHAAATARCARPGYVPGRLFSVNARNRRAACPDCSRATSAWCACFDDGAPPFALVLVGALFVGSMSDACGTAR